MKMSNFPSMAIISYTIYNAIHDIYKRGVDIFKKNTSHMCTVNSLAPVETPCCVLTPGSCNIIIYEIKV